MKTLSLILSAAFLSVAVSGAASAAHKDNRYDKRFLSKHEAVQDAMRSFRHLDRNHNGIVRYKEAKRAYHRVNHRNHRGNYDNRWYRDIGYRQHARRDSQIITVDNFHKFDKNGDRRLSKKEVKKKIRKKFDKADRNYDGYLSRREIERSKWFSRYYDSGRDYRDGYRDRDRRRR